jgi:peptidyl-prolyl cis-trans isomerase B (cyclophilin B)
VPRVIRRAASRWPRRRSSRPGPPEASFFIVTAPDAGLPPDYAVAGKVVKGMNVAREIDELGDPAGGPAPTQTVLLEKASLDVS